MAINSANWKEKRHLQCKLASRIGRTSLAGHSLHISFNSHSPTPNIEIKCDISRQILLTGYLKQLYFCVLFWSALQVPSRVVCKSCKREVEHKLKTLSFVSFYNYRITDDSDLEGIHEDQIQLLALHSTITKGHT